MRRKLGDIASVVTGYHVRGSIPMYSAGTFRIIQAKDIRHFDHAIETSSLYRIDEVPSPIKYLVRKGDVIFAPRGTRNFASPILEELSDVVVAGHFYILRVDARTVLPEYLAWYMNQPPAQQYLKNHARGSGIKMIPRRAVEDLRVPVPSMDRQRAIAELGRLAAVEHDLGIRLAEARRGLAQVLCLQAAKQ